MPDRAEAGDNSGGRETNKKERSIEGLVGGMKGGWKAPL